VSDTDSSKIVTNPFNRNLTYSSVSDIDGNIYKTIQIGTRYPGSGFKFWGIGEYCSMWSSTGTDATHVYYREIYNNSGQIYRKSTNNEFGFSVRCIKD